MAGLLCPVPPEPGADHDGQRRSGAPAAVRFLGRPMAALRRGTRRIERSAQCRGNIHGQAVMNDQPTRIEHHTIYPIPASERHGRARDLFTVWFGSNIMILTIVTGALATVRFQLSMFAAILAILAGNLVGGVFMALHAAQGPQLGVPQMVQSRGQFGSFGAIFIVALVIVMYLGFVASNLVLGGQSLHSIVGGISDQTGIVLIALLSVAAAIYGYDLIHAYARWMTWFCGAALAACFFWVLAVDDLPGPLA